MLTNKGLGKILVCLVLILACLVVANPVSAMSTMTAPGDDALVQSDDLRDGTEDSDVDRVQDISYVRYSASSGSLVVGCLAEGTVLSVLGSKNDYYKIDCYDMVGYIAKSQVTLNEAGEYIVRVVADNRESGTMPVFSAQEALTLRTQIEEVATRYIGVPYVYGGTSPRGFDCSGYVGYVFRKLGITLYRTAAQQASNGIVVAREDMQPGDLVIFSNTSGYRFGTHVGIYLGNNKVIHSGTRKGVSIVDMSTEYFDVHFQCARRVIVTETNGTAGLPAAGSITDSIGSSWRTETSGTANSVTGDIGDNWRENG